MRSEVVRTVGVVFGLSFFIYAEHFGFSFPLLFSVITALSLYFWLTSPKNVAFWIGALTGLLWFWWVGLSLRYYDLFFLYPFFLLIVALTYGTIFLFLQVFPLYIRAFLFLFYFDYVCLFGFDWFKPEVLLSATYFSPTKWGLLALMGAIVLISFNSKRAIIGGIFVGLLTLIPSTSHVPPSLSLKIKLAKTDVPQDKKWNKAFIQEQISENMHLIDKAITNGDDIIVLPENAFPFFLNEEKELVAYLEEKSFHITIIAGALRLDNDKKNYYNSTYVFEKGVRRVADKYILVPFGEEVPFPSFLRDWVNALFFDGAGDYKKAPHPSNIVANGITFRNAICYEATNEKIFADNPPYMIAISNNSWFVPSIEPTLQRLIMQYLSNKHGTMIFHTTNQSPFFIISPQNLF